MGLESAVEVTAAGEMPCHGDDRQDVDGDSDVLRAADLVGDAGTWNGRGFNGQRCALARYAEHV